MLAAALLSEVRGLERIAKRGMAQSIVRDVARQCCCSVLWRCEVECSLCRVGFGGCSDAMGCEETFDGWEDRCVSDSMHKMKAQLRTRACVSDASN